MKERSNFSLIKKTKSLILTFKTINDLYNGSNTKIMSSYIVALLNALKKII